MGIYLRAPDGAYADKVLVAGDPGRITRIGRGLDGSTLVTDNRGLVGYTGYHKDVRVSVQSSGMGCPSMAMVGSELIAYGVRQIVRVGTCSAFGRGVRNGDLIVVTGAAAGDGATRSLAGCPYTCVPSLALTASLVAAARGRVDRCHVGPVITVDVEPHLSANSTLAWYEQGLLAVEMESAVLFLLALRAQGQAGREVQAASVLTVSDGLQGHPDGAQQYLSDEDLSEATDRMHKVALDALLDVPTPGGTHGTGLAR